MTLLPRHFAERLALLVLSLTGLVTVALFSSLPARMATHFDWHGRADAWHSRAFVAIMLPALAAAIWALLRIVAQRAKEQRAAMSWVAGGTVVFMCALHLLLLAHAQRPDLDVTQLTCLGCGAFFAFLGLLLPKVKQNPWVGVRTYWTLRSPEVWARTQRVAGAAFFVGGAVVAVLALLAPAIALPALLVIVLGIVALSFGYSWRISSRAA